MKIYRSEQIYISKKAQPDVYAYLLHYASLAKNLYNAALYRLRQTYTAQNETELTPNQLEIQREQLTICRKYNLQPLTLLTYDRLNLMMKEYNNPDYFSDLPKKSIQFLLQLVCQTMKNFHESIKEYERNPDKFHGKPQIPKYCKHDTKTFIFSNQDVILDEGYVYFPKTNVHVFSKKLSMYTMSFS